MATFSIFDETLSDLRQRFEDLGHQSFRANQIYRWVFKKYVFDFAMMKSLPASLRLKLSSTARIDLPKVVKEETEPGSAHKFALNLSDGHIIESVLIRDRDRRTLCLSAQIGCPLGCTFCASGKHGFVRNLRASEIVGQYLAVCSKLKPSTKISNLVFMGMGEPLLNADAVLTAIRIFNDPDGAHIGARKITISTIGIAKGLERLQELDMQFNLALSLHAVDPDVRSRLVPARQVMNPNEIREFCCAFTRRAGREVTIEYVLVRGVNDSPEDARALADYVRDIPCNVNLIPYNPHPFCSLESPSDKNVTRFKRTLQSAGVKAPVRKSCGQNIHAACGQLAMRT
ncbi:MAG: 23S rRNA (adenine(2503)-C(2))-methyltransferase RlmN [Planctomycetota bacterium]|nr:MAG: 23S rRNA (adenine(2503)-C(2))-methyltransferase RlmN [Planctomycetota bacterium]